MKNEFDEDVYHYRNLAETMFSVLKRKCREELRATKYRNQVKEGNFYFSNYSNEDFYRAKHS